ncbi:MAG: AMP-binding protein, partial [Bdellovibrionales bacterium]|nr:AMP-binding protein [Bdellovibrionales bacterium]
MSELGGKTLPELFVRAAKSEPARVLWKHRLAPARPWTEVTLGEAYASTRLLFHGLKALKVEEGQAVALILRTGVDRALWDLACLCSGAVAVHVDPMLPQEAREALLRQINPVLVVAPAACVPPDFRTVVLDPAAAAPSESALALATFHRLSAEHALDDPSAFERWAFSVPPSALAVLQISSAVRGTEPRIAAFTQGALVEGFADLGQALGGPARNHWIVCAASPFSPSCPRLAELGAVA